MIPPVARIRVRAPIAPAARVRIRADVPVPMKVWRAPYSVPDNMPPAEVCTIGEIDNSANWHKWRGWPEGSLYSGMQGRIHKGRTILTRSGKYHVIRWQPFTKCYVYVKLAKDHEAAILSL